MKQLFVLLLLLFFSIPLFSCDVCGCSLGGNYFGILPLYNKNFIGLRWSQASFHSYIAPTQYHAAQESDDTYSKVELWGRFHISKRIQLFAFVPYVYNDMNGTDQVVFAQGIGDVSIVANYRVINNSEGADELKHTLLFGGGIKLPTGKFSLTDKGKIINRNFQMGTGSVDFIGNAVYTMRYRKVGINLETGYKLNTRNSNDYLFGNQFRVSAQLFFWQKIGPLSILPHAGVYFEQADTHWDGDIIQTNTGGSATQGSAGIDFYISHFTLGINFQHPLKQHYNSDITASITSYDMCTATLIFNF
ncbi:MAG TPA: hypothetical protein PLR06_00410 [Cyclobacteriaceae bacterium]|nr:hypothetical protein [Cyclobacteriaceae bacterium]